MFLVLGSRRLAFFTVMLSGADSSSVASYELCLFGYGFGGVCGVELGICESNGM